LDSTGQSSFLALTALPSGLQLQGLILNGIPLTAGRFSFSVNMTDQISKRVSRLTFNINIRSVELATGDLPRASIQTPFQISLNTRGGIGAISFNIFGAPDWMDINNNVLFGTPQASGLYSFSVYL
jgi:hypothetical protein